LAVNYVEGNSEADSMWKEPGFKSSLITATAKLNEAKAALGSQMTPIEVLERRTPRLSEPNIHKGSSVGRFA
jgi:hypothetical protein